ncbi:uncharacterized protein K460DRAFT_279040 [Cucurbitaria berberidis CBS 394.84]|uniref:Uncharacterized protein n=1 Tax=Cucurbitaria berberidis CBS 394.84 TaxID=1168544 RepID=A0A9P4GMV3_9PLEO|nr:uncharacterized protein K460DRAFT_279040 [Cucurbitaria berberidis CBS 394.84]KAF1848206.1 hypothetical protein K460DRAFT_279040 [Cucurbitaria berberidis CBS 394.84]
MTLQPPFALFVLDKDITNEYLNNSLVRAYNGDYQSGWNLWVATDSYDDLPPPQQTHQPPPEATKPPLPADFSSPWVGKTVEDCAKWLQEMPVQEGVYAESVNRDYFTAMNEFSKEEDMVLVCRFQNKDNGNTRVDYFPQSTDEVQMQMWTNLGSKFDEQASNYRDARRFEDNKPDRSKFKSGGPY